jgi:uncharacterized protein YndB with AHSA1/START domain
VWDVVGDPHHLPRWWPRVQRVEAVEGGRWTSVFATDRGRTVRADFEVLRSSAGQAVAWRQDLEGSPFGRVLEDAVTEVRLEGEGGAATRVTVELRQKLRGFARLAPFLVRRANRRLLDEALDGLETCTVR